METYYILATSRGYNLTLQVVQGVPAALESVSPPGENKKLTPGGFAIELTKTAQSQPYQNNGKGFDFPICSSKIA
jgi:hypothetical protein